MLVTRNFYVVKQTDGTLWNFTYKDNFGIIYRTFDKESWSTYNILVKNASKAFSVLILPDNRICIIYQSSSGNLLLKVYSDNNWKEHSILHKKSNSENDIHFKTMYVLGKIQIFYSILQPQDNMRILFHQTLTLSDNLSVSSPVLIDTTNVNHINQFVVHALEDNTICIMYQKLINKYELGYKILDVKNPNWSKFYSVDKNLSPYTDYSLSSINDKLNILYIKNNGETSILYNFRGYISNLEHTKITESSNLISCVLFRDRDITYSFWISNNYIYSYNTNGTGVNSSPIKSEALKSTNILKSTFIEISPSGLYISNELYVQDGITLTILPNNFFADKEVLEANQQKLVSSNSNSENHEKYVVPINSSYSNMNHLQGNPPNSDEEKFISKQTLLIKKDQLINQLNYIIKDEKNKVLLLNNKTDVLEKDYLEWETQKAQLYKDISLLQEALIEKDNQIHEIQKALISKDSQFNELEKDLTIKDSGIHKLENAIIEKGTELLNINKIIEGLNLKITTLEEENTTLINDKTNSSLFKKLFSSQ